MHTHTHTLSEAQYVGVCVRMQAQEPTPPVPGAMHMCPCAWGHMQASAHMCVCMLKRSLSVCTRDMCALSCILPPGSLMKT